MDYKGGDFVPQIGASMRIEGVRYKVGDVIYDYDKREIEVQSSIYIDYIKSEAAQRYSSKSRLYSGTYA